MTKRCYFGNCLELEIGTVTLEYYQEAPDHFIIPKQKKTAKGRIKWDLTKLGNWSLSRDYGEVDIGMLAPEVKIKPCGSHICQFKLNGLKGSKEFEVYVEIEEDEGHWKEPSHHDVVAYFTVWVKDNHDQEFGWYVIHHYRAIQYVKKGEPPPSPPPCIDGDTKCEGYDLYECQNGEWVLIEKNSPACGYAPEPEPECKEGRTKCVGYDLYECVNGEWVLKKANSPVCGAPPPTFCDYDYILCIESNPSFILQHGVCWDVVKIEKVSGTHYQVVTFKSRRDGKIVRTPYHEKEVGGKLKVGDVVLTLYCHAPQPPPPKVKLKITVGEGGYVEFDEGAVEENTTKTFEVDKGSTFTFYAITKEGYEFKRWIYDSKTYNIGTITLTIDKDMNIKVEWEKKEVPPSPECSEGETKCVGYDLYECKDGKWVLKEKNSEVCGYTPTPPSPECNEGETKCIGYDLYECQNGKWVLKEKNSEICGYTPNHEPPDWWPDELKSLWDMLWQNFMGLPLWVWIVLLLVLIVLVGR